MFRMKDGMFSALHCRALKCAEVTSACIGWEGAGRGLGWEARAGQRGSWHRWSLQVSEGIRYYSKCIFLYSTVNHAFLRGAMRRNSVRFTHSLVRAHREGTSDAQVWKSNRVLQLSAVIFTGGKF